MEKLEGQKQGMRQLNFFGPFSTLMCCGGNCVSQWLPTGSCKVFSRTLNDIVPQSCCSKGASGVLLLPLLATSSPCLFYVLPPPKKKKKLSKVSFDEAAKYGHQPSLIQTPLICSVKCNNTWHPQQLSKNFELLGGRVF